MDRVVIRIIETIGPFFAYLGARIRFVHEDGWEMVEERLERAAVVTVIGVMGVLLQLSDWDTLLGVPMVIVACVWMVLIVMGALWDSLLLPINSYRDDR